VVLGEAFWRSRFNGDPTVVGRAIRLDGATFTIVGVVSKEFQLLGRSSIWGLMPLHGASASARSLYVLQAIGRLKPGVTADAAGADMAAVAEGLAREYPNSNMGRGITLEPMRDALVGSELRLTSILFLAVVAFVLVLCCANVANLLLARATVRARELAIRSALGASRTRVVRQLLTESLVLSVAGGVVGLAVGAVILTVAPSFIPQGLLPAAVRLTFDARVVIFCAATTVLVGFLFGAAPAWQVTACTGAEVMASGNRSSTARGGLIRGFLVIGEVATAVVLLFCAGLLLRTLLAIERRDPGYRAESVLTMTVDPLDSRGLLQFYESVDEEIKTLPGVRSAAWASTLPFGASYGGQSLFEIVGEPPLPNESGRPTADYQIVSPAYFRTLDLPVVAGRGFTDRDRRDSVPVCIVNEAFVRGPLQGRSPIGVRVALRPTAAGQQPPVVREIVGVARQVKGRPDETEDLVQVYVPLAQDTIGDIFLVVRPTSGPAEALAPVVRGAIARVDREQLVSVRGVMTLDNVRWEATASHRFRAVLVTAFAGLALVLAMVGLFGILAYSIQQRARDFGVRRALGATTGDVLRLVVGSAARVTAAGVVIGLALSTALGRLLASMLFGVQPSDPVTFAVVTLVLTLTAGVSTVGPAWRATRIDPAVALRSE
jgi:putative ABC transport system permease protein